MVASLTSTVCPASRFEVPDKEKARLSYMKSPLVWTPACFQSSSSLEREVSCQEPTPRWPILPLSRTGQFEPFNSRAAKKCKDERVPLLSRQSHRTLRNRTVTGELYDPSNKSARGWWYKMGSGDACAGHRLYCCTLQPHSS